MKKPNNIETELNAIRVDFYEKTKDMSPTERVAYLKEQTEPVHKEFGLKTVSGTNSDRQKVAL